MGAAMEQASKQNTPSTGHTVASTQTGSYAMALVPTNIPTQLHFVTTLSQLGEDAVRFATDSIVGYVIRSDGDDGIPAGEIIAFSASCTHMGCIVQWQSSDRQFHCPCHNGVFTEYGKPSASGSLRYLAPLPRLETIVMDGKIYVKVPITGK
jgi:Rieske Fe-S protein